MLPHELVRLLFSLKRNQTGQASIPGPFVLDTRTIFLNFALKIADMNRAALDIVCLTSVEQFGTTEIGYFNFVDIVAALLKMKTAARTADLDDSPTA
jgi:hypothetical protein